MSELHSLLAQIDSLCGQLAAAIQAAEPRLYPMLGIAVLAAFLAFRPKDPDQI